MRLTGHVACEGREGVDTGFCCGFREKDPFEWTDFNLEDNIKMDLQEVGWVRHGLD
jgi:hypothetical protein